MLSLIFLEYMDYQKSRMVDIAIFTSFMNLNGMIEANINKGSYM